MGKLEVRAAITESTPELKADLERLPSNARPERMRMLATIGLAVLGQLTSGGLQIGSGANASSGGPPVVPAAPSTESRKEGLADKLRQSVADQ
jgi:hypothetical protein